MARELFNAFTAIGPMGTQKGPHANLPRGLHDCRDFFLSVRMEPVDGNDRRHPEFANVLDVTPQVGTTDPYRIHVPGIEVLFADPTVHLQRSNGGDNHRRAGFKTRLAALDVKELLRAEVSAEACFCHHIVA